MKLEYFFTVFFGAAFSPFISLKINYHKYKREFDGLKMLTDLENGLFRGKDIILRLKALIDSSKFVELSLNIKNIDRPDYLLNIVIKSHQFSVY